MRATFTSFSRQSAAAALAIAPLASFSILGAAIAGPAMAKSAVKEAPKVSNSPEFTKVAGPFQKTFNETAAKKGKVPDADLKTAAAALVPQLPTLEANVKSPLDKLIFGDWERQIGGWTQDAALESKGLQTMLDSGQLQPAMVTTVSAMLGQRAYLAKDYPTAIKVLSPLMSDPKVDDAVPQMLAESYASTGQPTQGLDALKAAIAARKAANLPAPEEWYSRGNRIAYNAKLPAQSVEWALLMVTTYPSALNWLAAAQLVRNSQTDFTGQEELDISRLLDQTGALKLEPKYINREYVAYLQAIDARRFPGEAVRIADQGVAVGALKAGDTFVKDVMTTASPRVAADKASLPSLATAAASAPSGKIAAAAGDTFLSYGDAAKADELYTMALSKGGVDADKDRILTRLGIAQVDEGKYPDAKATLAKVGGTRVAIAKLWSLYADQKATGK